MTHPTHLIAGALVGHITGDYTTALIVSVIIDIDHLPSMIYHKVFKSNERLFSSLVRVGVPHEARRGIFHNILSFFILSVIVSRIYPDISFAFALAYIVHLMLDMLDNANTYIFYPFSTFNVRGPIKFFSLRELYFAIALLCILVVAILT